MRVFVSYSSPDRAIAERLATASCAWGDRIEVFLDTWTLQPGAFWLPALAGELERADAVLLLLGKTSPGNWQTLEFYAAFDRKAKQPNFPIIPVVLTNPAPRLPFLGQLHWLRFDDPAAEPALARLLPA